MIEIGALIAGSLPGWSVAVIIAMAVLFVLAAGGIVFLLLYKKGPASEKGEPQEKPSQNTQSHSPETEGNARAGEGTSAQPREVKAEERETEDADKK